MKWAIPVCMIDDVVLRSLTSISFGYWRIRSALPFGIRSGIENLLGITPPTKAHLKRIESLGLSIGLGRNEIRAATSPPIEGTGYMPRTSSPLVTSIVCRVLCIVILLGVLVVSYFVVANQGSVYTPGTKYGSISPNNFS